MGLASAKVEFYVPFVALIICSSIDWYCYEIGFFYSVDRLAIFGANKMTTKPNLRIAISYLAIVLATASMLAAQSSSSYHIAHTYTVGGDGSWDYVVPDPPNHRLFIGRENRV